MESNISAGDGVVTGKESIDVAIDWWYAALALVTFVVVIGLIGEYLEKFMALWALLEPPARLRKKANIR